MITNVYEEYYKNLNAGSISLTNLLIYLNFQITATPITTVETTHIAETLMVTPTIVRCTMVQSVCMILGMVQARLLE